MIIGITISAVVSAALYFSSTTYDSYMKNKLKKRIQDINSSLKYGPKDDDDEITSPG